MTNHKPKGGETTNLKFTATVDGTASPFLFTNKTELISAFTSNMIASLVFFNMLMTLRTFLCINLQPFNVFRLRLVFSFPEIDHIARTGTMTVS